MNLIQKSLRIIDDYLNNITMYRLLVYGLGLLAAVAIGLSGVGLLSLKPIGLIESLAILIGVSYVTNKFMAWAWDAPVNSESWLITALILFFILPQPTTLLRFAGIIVAGILGMATKFILAYHRKHFFNPAAIAMVIVGWTGLAYSSWWVASEHMLPFTLLLGFLVTRKLRRFMLVFTFGFAALGVMVFHGMQQHLMLIDIVKQSLESWPTVFLGTIMLTEPATLPPFLWQQLTYALLVGLIFASQVQIGPIATTPALALVIGNVYSYMMSPKYGIQMRLKRKIQLSPHIYDFAFVPERPLRFTAGQYADWTLPHKHVDSRGNRRTFTIASSPTRQEVHIGLKIADGPSSFKKALLQMEPGDPIMASQFSGTFVMPRNKSRKLVFVAGGIGITPFLSMLTYIFDAHEQRDVVLFHLVSSLDDIGYDSLLERFSDLGVKVVPILRSKHVPATWQGHVGGLTPELLAKEVPDYNDRTYYLSGPNGMVEHFQDMLHGVGVKSRHVITDYFSGY
jgi:ferredoxin-NADP reductase